MVRFHWFAALLLAASFSIVGCSDDSGSTDRDAGQDVTPDVQQDQSDGGTCGEATACRGNADCNAATEFCNAGCCAPRQVEETCTSQDQSCTDASWSNDNFVCDSGLNLCLARCDADTTDASQPDACGAGGWCFELNDPGEADLDGVCLTGDCNDACFDPDDCSDGQPYTCDSGDGSGTCFAFGNGASFCLPAGDVTEGNACVVNSDQADETCSDGLFCHDGNCVLPCTTTAECDGDDTCVPVFDQAGDNQPGLCGEACEEFSQGQCSNDYFCGVQIGSFSGNITAFICVEPASDTIIPNGGDCDPSGEEGTGDNVCAEGNVCVIEFENDAVGTCQQLCDSTLEGTGALAACPEAEPTPIFVDGEGDELFYEYEQSAEDAFLAGSGLSFQVALAPETEGGAQTVAAVLNNVDLAAGEAYSVPAFLTDGATLDIFTDLTAGTSAPGEGMAGLRAYNVSSVNMDVYRADGILDQGLSPGDVGGWVSLAYGDAGTNLLTVYEDDVEAGYYFDHIAIEDETSADIVELVVFDETDVEADAAVFHEIFVADIPADLDTTGAAVRVVHAAPSFATIDVDFPPAGAGDENVDGVPYGGVTAEDAADWYVAPIGDGLTANIPIAIDHGESTTNYTVADAERGDVFTLVLVDGESVPEVIEAVYNPSDDDEIAPVEGDDIVVQTIDASSYDVMIARESDTLGSVDGGATLPLADGSIDIDTGTFAITLRPFEGAFSDAPAYTTDSALEIVADEVAELWIWDLDGDDAGQDLFLTEYIAPDLEGLEDDEASLRFVHLVDGAGPATLQLRGEVLQVCAPLTIEGLGRCTDSCEAYRGGDPAFVDEDGEPTERWLTNGCNHTEDVEYACLPFTSTGDEDTPVELSDDPPNIEAFCAPRAVPDDGWNGFGDNCTSTGDALCNPDAFCVGVGDNQAECLKLCLPFSGSEHSDCQYTLDQDGQPIDVETMCQAAIVPQSFGFCNEVDLTDHREGDECTQAQGGSTCGDDDTLCISTPNEGYACRRVCKKEIDETCPDLADGTAMTCRPDLAFAPPIPDYISVCGPAEE